MKMQDAIMHLLLKSPFYGYIAASITPIESINTASINTIMTLYPKIIYNREWFEALEEEQAIGAMIHELLHLILLHPFRRGGREAHLWVVACDMAVNEHIDQGILPGNSVTVRTISDEIKEELPRYKSAEFYYDIISKGDAALSLIEKDGHIKVVLCSGQELKANTQIEGETSEINKNAVKSMISDLVDQAGAEGEIPGGLSAPISDIYGSGEVNWRNVLKRFLTGKGKVTKRKTCKRESKRFDNLPGSKRSVGMDALLAMDESGSISNMQIMKFYNELLLINKITGASLKVTQFDTECTQPIPLERYIKERKRLKNGGTDFRPIFQLADKLHIPLLIIFTDGDGTAPEQADQKVLWVLVKGGKKPAGFGHSVTFDA